MRLPVVNAIWIGRELGRVYCACLSSFLRHGHRVVLHCYERPRDTPTGIEIADANKLLPQSRVIRHRKSGSLSLFSNLLRYELLGAGLGLYVDCDVYCLRPIEDADYILGWQGRNSLANGVLKLPPDCPVLAALRAIKDTPNFVPPWLERRKRRLEWLRGPAPALPLEDLPWGTTGPKALAYYAHLHGIDHLASPIDRFYPVNGHQAELLFDPALTVQELITHRTDAIHLYGTHQRDDSLMHKGIPKGSPLWEMTEAALK